MAKSSSTVPTKRCPRAQPRPGTTRCPGSPRRWSTPRSACRWRCAPQTAMDPDRGARGASLCRRAHAFADDVDDGLKIFPALGSERPCVMLPIKERFFLPFGHRHGRHDLLREHVQPLLGNDQAVELPAPTRDKGIDSSNSSRDSGNNRPLGVPPIECPARPTRCKKVEIARSEPIWHTSRCHRCRCPSPATPWRRSP